MLVHNRLVQHDILWEGDNFCLVNGGHREDIDHLFFHID